MPIVQKENPILRKKAVVVPHKDITGLKIRRLLKTMREALAQEDDGVALAAPQVGASLRIFIIADRLPEPKGENTPEKKPPDKSAKAKEEVWENIPLVYINPVILKLSREKAWEDEGCLSVRPLYGRVHRSKKATIRAYDENGLSFERGASGLLAQIFQHETDHLDGILFIDKAKDVQEIPPPKQRGEA